MDKARKYVFYLDNFLSTFNGIYLRYLVRSYCAVVCLTKLGFISCQDYVDVRVRDMKSLGSRDID